MVLRHDETLPSRYHRPLGLVRDGDAGVDGVPKSRAVGSHHGNSVLIVPVRVHRQLVVRQQAQGEHASVNGEVLSVGALHRPPDHVVNVLVRGPVGVQNGGGVLPPGELGTALGGDDRRLVHLRNRHN